MVTFVLTYLYIMYIVIKGLKMSNNKLVSRYLNRWFCSVINLFRKWNVFSKIIFNKTKFIDRENLHKYDGNNLKTRLQALSNGVVQDLSQTSFGRNRVYEIRQNSVRFSGH